MGNPRVIRALRWLLGALFLFSSATKIIDPVGTSIYVEKYLAAYHLEWFKMASVGVAVALSVVEFTLGVMLLFGAMRRCVALLSLLLVALFTIVTLLSATLLPIGDCGCFGAVLTFTPWGTFLKNVLLLVVAYVVWRGAEKMVVARRDLAVILGAVTLLLGVNIYTLNTQPMLDLTPYSVGTNLREDVDKEREDMHHTLLRFKNIATGEVEEFSEDSMECWLRDDLEYLDARVLGYDGEALYADFAIYDRAGNDIYKELLSCPHDVAWITIYNLRAVPESFDKIVEELLVRYSSIVVLTSTPCEELPQLGDIPVYNVDAMTLRTINRAPCGVIVVSDGVIKDKYSL